MSNISSIRLFIGALVRTSTDEEYEKIFDDKLDDQLMAQNGIDSEWVHLMTAGPLAVNYIGNLLVLASQHDFPLVRPPQFTFQHIQNPNSFRATLTQVIGSMYSALLAAHTAMDRIQINMQEVPGHVKAALTLVSAGSPVLIEIMLPKTLEAVSRITNESTQHARTTLNKLTSFSQLIDEVIVVHNHTRSIQNILVRKEMIEKMAGLDVGRMSEKGSVDVLSESIIRLNEIREQWGRLVQLFFKLSVQADANQQVCQ